MQWLALSDLNTDSGNRPPRTPLGAMASIDPAYRDTMSAPNGDDWRGAFAASLVQDPMFARNLANRLWKQMFGLPLADPVDGLDPARLDLTAPPPEPWGFQATHPELLEKGGGAGETGFPPAAIPADDGAVFGVPAQLACYR